MFQTKDRILIPAVTSAQMREIDRIAIEETGPNILQMMENAGASLAECTIDLLGAGWKNAKIIVLAGSGGNGGGGLCAVRHLSNRNAKVRFCVANAHELTEATAWQKRVLRFCQAEEIGVHELDSAKPDLIIDALIGYGLDAKPHGVAHDLISWMRQAQSNVLSLDIPSGVDATTGQHPGAFVQARRTLTLALPKTGLIPESAGEIFLADIGIPPAVYRRLNLNYHSPFDARSVIRLDYFP